MIRLVTVAIVIAVASGVDAAPMRVGLDYTAARGSRFESLDLGWRLEAGLFFRYGRWRTTASLSGLMNVESQNVERDGRSLIGIGGGGRITYHRPISRAGVALAAIGFERIWLSGHDPVRRGCRQTHECLVGYYTENPDYDAWTPQFRLGIGAFAPTTGMDLGSTLELIVEPIYFADVPPNGLAGIAAFIALTATIGGGTKP